jgi:hypothetical protein
MTTAEQSTVKPKKLLTAFRLGLLVGLLLPWIAWKGFTASAGPEPEFNVEVVSRGADLSGHGAVQLAVRSARDEGVVQTCRGACDDLLLRERTGDNSYSVQARDASGACVACGGIGYVSGGYSTGLDRAVVSGADRLVVRSSTIYRRPDGSLEETMVTERPAPGANSTSRTPRTSSP